MSRIVQGLRLEAVDGEPPHNIDIKAMAPQQPFQLSNWQCNVWPRKRDESSLRARRQYEKRCRNAISASDSPVTLTPSNTLFSARETKDRSWREQFPKKSLESPWKLGLLLLTAPLVCDFNGL